jgi:hypothetical protein
MALLPDSGVSMRSSRYLAGGLVGLLIALVFVLQSYNVGFWSFRHGWTSVHGMAIISRSEPQNQLVGYSMMWRDADGDAVYEYFDRYPPFFSASVNAVLGLADDIPTEIYLARLYMNVFFAGSLFFGYRLTRLFIQERLLAVGVVALAFSSYYLLYYRDMIDFYQPVAMNFLVMAYSIARYRLYGERWQVILVAGGLTLVSFGYAMLFIIGVWFLVEGVERLRVGAALGERLRGVIVSVPVVAGVLSLALTIGAIGNNVLTEAAIRDVPVSETSVVDSILRRLPFVEGAVTETAREQAATAAGLRGWGTFAVVEVERLMKWSLPLRTGGTTGIRFVPGISEPEIVWTPEPLRAEVTTARTPPTVMVNGWLLIGAVVGLAAVIRFIARLEPRERGNAIIIAFGGFPLVFGIINLTSVHDYTLMFALGFNVMLWTALLRPLAQRRWAAPLVALVGIAVFTYSLAEVREAQRAEVEEGAPFTYDFDRIRNVLPVDARQTVYLNVPRENPECVIRSWQCFALGYYLGDNYLTTHREYADFALGFVPYYMADPFVAPGETTMIVAEPTHPQNERLYLQDLSIAETRTAPVEASHRFGESLGLGAWALRGDATVRPCQRITVESWWTVDTPPDANYNLQIVLVTEDGQSLSEANRPLGTVPTEIWEPGRFTYDARSLIVPCGTLPGSYPLIMGAYDPEDLQPLPVRGTDGAEIGNQLYLTTITVEGVAS